MTTPRMSSTDVSAAAAGLLGEPIAEAAALPVSYANETWRVVTYSGARHVLKIGPLDGVRRLFTDLGAALRALHEIELDGFSSRLDGSAPSFAR